MERRLPLDLIGLGLLATICAAAYFARPVRTPAPPPKAVEEDDGLAGKPMDLVAEAGTAAGAKLNREGVELAHVAKFPEAIAKLRQALKDAPGNKAVERNLQQVLVAWGLRELQWGQPRVAADRFVEALSFGRRPEILTGLGGAFVRGQQYSEAIAALEESLRLGAKDGATYFVLGQAYEGINDRGRALQMMKRAREAGLPSSEALAAIARLERDAHAEAEFGETSSSHFEVRFDAGEDSVAAAAVVRSLESAYQSVGRQLGYFPERATPVVLYAEQDFHRITQTPDWAGAVFDGRLKFPVRGLSAGADLDRVARHEYAHSLIAALTYNRAPAWLNEGLAMWVEDGGRGGDRGEAQDLMRRRSSDAFPLAAMSASFASMSAPQAEIAYSQSYLTVLYLAEHYGEARIGRFLEALRKHPSVAEAFAEVYAVPFAQFEAEVWRTIH